MSAREREDAAEPAVRSPESAKNPEVLVVGPGLEVQGGIAAVSRVYRSAGLFGPEIAFHASTRDGPAWHRLLHGIGRLAGFTIRRRRRLRLVHVHTSSGAGFWRKAAYVGVARAKGLEVLLHVHPSHFETFYARRGFLGRAAIRAVLRRSSHLLAVSQGLAGFLGRIVPDIPVIVLPNPVDVGEMACPEPPAREPALIAYLGWYVPWKGVFDLVEALAQMAGRGSEVRAVFGGSKQVDAVLEAVRARGLEDRVEVNGWMSRQEVRVLLHRCAVFVLPSHTEGFPMVLLEAMACGAPIVATPVGGIPEWLVEERNVLFAPPGNPARLAVVLERLLEDGVLRERMARDNREDVHRFDAAATVTALRRIYRVRP